MASRRKTQRRTTKTPPRWSKRFTVPAETARISPLVREVMRLFASHRTLNRRRHSVELALREALANAIVHGSRRNATKKVKVWVKGGPSGVFIGVSDEGRGFDHRLAPDPLTARHLHSDHGRGLFMIRRMMDEVRFARGGREIRMWKAERPGAAKARKA